MKCADMTLPGSELVHLFLAALNFPDSKDKNAQSGSRAQTHKKGALIIPTRYALTMK